MRRAFRMRRIQRLKSSRNTKSGKRVIGYLALQHRRVPAQNSRENARSQFQIKTSVECGDKRKDWLIGKTTTL
jgi:hypothetical protein